MAEGGWQWGRRGRSLRFPGAGIAVNGAPAPLPGGGWIYRKAYT
jgi:hypothetical protein